jgi:ferritin
MMASRRLSEERDLPWVFAKLVDDAAPEPAGRGSGRAHRPDGGADALPPAPELLPRLTTKRGGMSGRRLRHRLMRLVAAQLDAQQVGLGIAVYFDRRGLGGGAKEFRERSAESGLRAGRVTAFLAASTVDFELPGVASVPTQYKSPVRAVAVALDREFRVTRRMNAAADAAVAGRDHVALQLLQGLLEEQIERERGLRQLLAVIASGVNLFQAESFLDHLT